MSRPRKWNGIPFKLGGIPIKTDDPNCCCGGCNCDFLPDTLYVDVTFCTSNTVSLAEITNPSDWLLNCGGGGNPNVLRAWRGSGEFGVGNNEAFWEVACIGNGQDGGLLMYQRFNACIPFDETIAEICPAFGGFGYWLLADEYFCSADNPIIYETLGVPLSTCNPDCYEGWTYIIRWTDLPLSSPMQALGPGTVIKNLLASYGIQAKEKGCKCNSLAYMMDKDGPDKVEARIDYYVDEMRESIKEWKGRIPIPTPPDFVIRKLILHAVQVSRDKSFK